MFEHRLALALGLTLSDLGQMGTREFNRWFRYWLEEPWGSYRDNLHTGILASILTNVHRRKGSRRASVDDFMLMSKETRKSKDTRGMLDFFRRVGVRKNNDG
jgi:hypothetical protein